MTALLQRFLKQEQGFSLIEVIAAFTILSVAAIAMTTFFTNALTYSKGNQNKTVMVNLARNALFYMEKQNFDEIKSYFGREDNVEIACAIAGCADLSGLSIPADELYQVLNPTVNDIAYTIRIQYQDSVMDELEARDGVKMSGYLIPINVVVEPVDGAESSRDRTMVEGYIKNAKIR